jgi:D-psicose/D-tagatose/L-ribulose 3-epimerase
MRISISNIAWDIQDDDAVVEILKRYGVDAIEIAPGKYFQDIQNTKDEDIRSVRNWWQDRGIQITGMQSLLYGTKGLNLFASAEVQNAMLLHLTAVCRIGAGLGADRLVFGSPKNRDRSFVSDDEAMEISTSFFQRLGNIADEHCIVICLEPNPSCYGANFMTTSRETAKVVQTVAHPSIRMQLDTGALSINSESSCQVCEHYGDLIGHIHASEPNLIPLSRGSCDHKEMGKAVARYLPNHIVCIEMLTSSEESTLTAIEDSVRLTLHAYT